MAITNSAATLPGIIVPVFVGKLTHHDVRINFTLYQFKFLTNYSNFNSPQ